VAHIGYFRDEFVVRRRWLDEHAYADIVGLCQFLPGPASSQVGMTIGLVRAGWVHGLKVVAVAIVVTVLGGVVLASA
jgi:chromate transporter